MTRELGTSKETPSVQLTDAAQISWDASLSRSFTLTLTGDHKLLSPTNLVDGSIYALTITQGAGGSHLLTYSEAYRFPGGTSPTLSTDAGAVDLLEFRCDGTYLTLISTDLNSLPVISPPSNLAATSDVVSEIHVSWVDNSSIETDFLLDRSLNSDFSLSADDNTFVLPANTTSYVDNTILNLDTLYYYRIRARSGSRLSAYSNVASGKALSPP